MAVIAAIRTADYSNSIFFSHNVTGRLPANMFSAWPSDKAIDWVGVCLGFDLSRRTAIGYPPAR